FTALQIRGSGESRDRRGSQDGSLSLSMWIGSPPGLCWLSVIVDDLTAATHCGPIASEQPGLALRHACLRVELIATVIEETYDERFTKALNHDDVLDRLGHHRLRLSGGRSTVRHTPWVEW